ncbi:unnamed protein product [Lymnaea stagnalis]|uniref:SEFIR domain-containing protein n=1 Tax=Lymnaea stagnalis TaxID=6523 RepID=A0AAV2GYQ0_LYMST
MYRLFNMLLTERLANVVLLCCMIQPVVLVKYPCDLRIFVEDYEVDNTNICLGEYVSKECRPFVSSFSRSDLPQDYPNESLSIERPSNINLVGLNSPYPGDNNIYPGLTIQWGPPPSEAAKRDLEGFLIIWKDKDVFCRLFQLKPGSIQHNTKVTFSYDVERLNPVSNYSVIVYSTPPPKPGDQNDEKVFLRMSYTTFRQYPAQGFAPALWAPSLSVKTWTNGSVDVKFTLSPPEFNLTFFEVLLLKKSSGWYNFYQKVNYTGTVYSKKDPEGAVTFSNLPTDEYSVLVRPIDPFRHDVTKCLCWKNDTSKYCEAACASINSDVFLVNVTEEPEIKTPLLSTTTPLTVRPSSPTVERPTATPTAGGGSEKLPAKATDDETAWVIGGSTLGAVLFIIICLVFACWFRSKDSFSLIKVKKCFHRICLGTDKQKFSLSPSSVDPIPDNKGSPSIVKRTVYIMSADDHNAHIEVVKSLAQFLEVHCYCQVIYPPMEEDIDKEPYTWFLRSMSRTERIIFVDSEGAEKLVQAHIYMKTYKSRELPPQGDLFTMCLKHIFNNAEARSNLVLVHFGTDRCHKSLHYPPTFQLPKQFPGFLRCIHGISPKSSASYANCLPMCVDNIQALPQGNQLLSAVELSKSFERDNPHWSESYFGTASTELRTMQSCSGDSGINVDYDLGRSVSTQDLSGLDSASPTSPTSKPPFFGTRTNVDAIHPSQVPELSIFTVPCDYDSICPSSVMEQPDYTYAVIPPESPSQFVDSFSRTVNTVNKESGFGSIYEAAYENGSVPGEQYSDHFTPPSGLEDCQGSIHPPESPSDMDNTSSALREINYNYDKFVLNI